jgi:hypothetical protein
MFGFQWQCEQTGKQVMVRLYVVFDHVDDRVAITNWMNKCPAAHADIIDVVTEDDEEVPFHGFDIDWEDLK